ncbi:MAG TPA: hypothetical protein VK861_08990, partial [Bacteroidales bacterium]|nr:hypothetical protein [Bacteroidales bacterium]
MADVRKDREKVELFVPCELVFSGADYDKECKRKERWDKEALEFLQGGSLEQAPEDWRQLPMVHELEDLLAKMQSHYKEMAAEWKSKGIREQATFTSREEHMKGICWSLSRQMMSRLRVSTDDPAWFPTTHGKSLLMEPSKKEKDRCRAMTNAANKIPQDRWATKIRRRRRQEQARNNKAPLFPNRPCSSKGEYNIPESRRQLTPEKNVVYNGTDSWKKHPDVIALEKEMIEAQIRWRINKDAKFFNVHVKLHGGDDVEYSEQSKRAKQREAVLIRLGVPREHVAYRVIGFDCPVTWTEDELDDQKWEFCPAKWVMCPDDFHKAVAQKERWDDLAEEILQRTLDDSSPRNWRDICIVSHLEDEIERLEQTFEDKARGWRRDPSVPNERLFERKAYLKHKVFTLRWQMIKRLRVPRRDPIWNFRFGNRSLLFEFTRAEKRLWRQEIFTEEADLASSEEEPEGPHQGVAYDGTDS